VQGPQGPVCPAGPHQFCLLSWTPPLRNAILDFGIPTFSQIFAASSSF